MVLLKFLFYFGVAESLVTPMGKSQYTGPVLYMAQYQTGLNILTPSLMHISYFVDSSQAWRVGQRAVIGCMAINQSNFTNSFSCLVNLLSEVLLFSVISGKKCGCGCHNTCNTRMWDAPDSTQHVHMQKDIKFTFKLPVFQLFSTRLGTQTADLNKSYNTNVWHTVILLFFFLSLPSRPSHSPPTWMLGVSYKPHMTDAEVLTVSTFTPVLSHRQGPWVIQPGTLAAISH